MSNLLSDTTTAINSTGHAPIDIAFIGSADGSYGCTWDEFQKLADFEYDSGYGSAEVPHDLIVIFSDGTHLSRGEYDGSEWWDYNEQPSVPDSYIPIVNLQLRRGWAATVAEVNSQTDDD